MFLLERSLESRQSRCYYSGGIRRCTNNTWNGWARWLLLGLLVAGFILFFVIFSCISAKRRRRAGARPMWGTGWVPGPPAYGSAQYNQQPSYYAGNDPTQQPYYNNNNNNPPPYNPNGQNNTYYRGETGVSEPAATYQGQYKPPEGPPPAR